jgi:hypothetical protein
MQAIRGSTAETLRAVKAAGEELAQKELETFKRSILEDLRAFEGQIRDCFEESRAQFEPMEAALDACSRKKEAVKTDFGRMRQRLEDIENSMGYYTAREFDS